MKTIIEMAREAGVRIYNEHTDRKFEKHASFLGTCDAIEKLCKLVCAQERQEIYDEWHSCVMSDLEHGVSSLNQKAAAEWHKNYPAQSKMFPEWLEARS